jgi:hypothetical protein
MSNEQQNNEKPELIGSWKSKFDKIIVVLEYKNQQVKCEYGPSIIRWMNVDWLLKYWEKLD